MRNIDYGFRQYEKYSKTHTHDYGQMIIPTNGELIVETKTLNIAVDGSKMLFLPPGSEHKYASYTDNLFLVLDVPNHFITADDIVQNHGGKLILMNEKWELVKKLMLQECRSNESTTSMNNLFRYIYCDIFKGSEPASIEYLKKHYDRSVTLEELARIEGYASNYYSDWFKRYTGWTLSAYLKRLRINKTKELLLTTSYTLAQIAQLVGYEHHASLTRSFKCLEHMTPKEFRKMYSKH